MFQLYAVVSVSISEDPSGLVLKQKQIKVYRTTNLSGEVPSAFKLIACFQLPPHFPFLL